MRRGSGPRLPAGPLAAAALLAALAVVVGLAAYYLPLVGGVLMLITPLPVAIAYLRYGSRLGVLSAIVATIIAGLAGGPWAAIWMLCSGSIGIALGVGIGRRWRYGRTVLLASVVNVVALVIQLGLTGLAFGWAYLEPLWAVPIQAARATAATLRAMGPALERQAAMFELWAGLISQYRWVFGLSGIMLASAMWAVVWYNASAPVLTRLGIQVPAPSPVVPVARWHVPSAIGLVLLLVFVGATLVLGQASAPEGTRNAWALVGSYIWLAFAVQGLGLFAHLATRLDPPPLLRRLIIGTAFIALFAVPSASVILGYAGMFDLAADIRGFGRAARSETGAAPRGARGAPENRPGTVDGTAGRVQERRHRAPKE